MTYLDSMKEQTEKTLGIGTGALTAMQVKAAGGGAGPAQPLNPVTFVQYPVNGVIYWLPLFQ